MESEGAANKAVLNNVLKKQNPKKIPLHKKARLKRNTVNNEFKNWMLGPPYDLMKAVAVHLFIYMQTQTNKQPSS